MANVGSDGNFRRAAQGHRETGWQDVDTDELSERFRVELEKSFLRPVSEQCRQLEGATPALKKAADQLAESTRKLRAYHSEASSQ